MIRKGESKDAAGDLALETNGDEILFMDLQQMSKEFKLFNLIEASVAYIEKIQPEDAPESEDLYPVTSTVKSFTRPYLMPRKHVEYATFWFGATFVGFFSIIQYLRK